MKISRDIADISGYDDNLSPPNSTALIATKPKSLNFSSFSNVHGDGAGDSKHQYKTRLEGEEPPKPKPWLEQFHSLLVMNYNGELQSIDLCCKSKFFALICWIAPPTWVNDKPTAFSVTSVRKPTSLDYGFFWVVPTPDSLAYYDDVITRRPVHWVFYNATFDLVQIIQLTVVLKILVQFKSGNEESEAVVD
ncbi:hypothetical protein L2E82_30050 [Cichorium intybus]|uniref:Uncharacterized protein n=1 Tax=Cichorium intybus TaxID=13427 RepID=A0ACB9CZM1_CICIN|nr:hypothetical protein L2E82_30050 [Cichorium intybus]